MSTAIIENLFKILRVRNSSFFNKNQVTIVKKAQQTHFCLNFNRIF